VQVRFFPNKESLADTILVSARETSMPARIGW
jgi:hypothetical protein